MRGKRVLTLALVVTVAVATAPVATLGQAPTADGHVSPADPSTTDASVVGGVGAQQTGQTACNYTRLYNQTIDSVTLVRTQSGLGSGFVFDRSENGTSYVVTNQHVVNGIASVGMQFNRGELRRGEVIGATPFADLAVVRVTETPDYVEALPVSNATPQVGQRVAALGSPYGLESTMTSGIISGTERLTPTLTGLLPNTIQTDAPINPGNSGGPLVLCQSGEVVGVNRAGGAENIGFAISSSLVNRIVPELIDDGEFEYPFLGIQPAPLTQALVQANDLDVTQGVYVAEAASGTPAGETLQGATGFEVVDDQRVPVGGDVIVGIGNQSVQTPEDLLSYLLTETQPGDTVEMTIVRDGERQTVTVQVVERPEPQQAA